MSTSNFVPDFVAEGVGSLPAPVAPVIVSVALVGGVVLVSAKPAGMSGTVQVVQMRLWRGPSADGPWTAFPAQTLSKIAVETLLLDFNPAYGVQEFYAVSALDASGTEGSVSAPLAFSAAWSPGAQENLPTTQPPTLAADYGPGEPEDLLTDQFPEVPYNFLAAPPGLTIGPLHLLIQKAALAIIEFRGRVLQLLQGISVQTAQGAALDAHAPLYGTYRYASEVGQDDVFRARLVSLAAAGRGRLADIKAAVQGHYNDLAAAAGVPAPIVTVFDLRSNPVQAVADGLQILDFEISVTFTYAAANAWFLSQAYLGVNSYLAVESPIFVSSLGTDFDAIIARTKAANTNAVYKIQAVYD